MTAHLTWSQSKWGIFQNELPEHHWFLFFGFRQRIQEHFSSARGYSTDLYASITAIPSCSFQRARGTYCQYWDSPKIQTPLFTSLEIPDLAGIGNCCVEVHVVFSSIQICYLRENL